MSTGAGTSGTRTAGELHDLWSEIVAGRRATGPAGRIVVAPAGLDLHAGGHGLLAVVGLAAALVDRGWGVTALRGADLGRTAVPDVDVVLNLVPDADVASVPDGVLCLGWALEVSRWLERPGLDLYDVVLAPSALGATALSEARPGPVEVLAPPVDVALFAGRSRPRRRGEPVVVGAGEDTDLVELPSRIVAASAVVAPVDPAELRFGAVSPVVLEAIAASTPVVTTSALGLGELGLSAVTVQHDPAATSSYVDGPVDPSLRETVRTRHSTDARADELLDVIARHLRPAAAPLLGFLPDFTEANPYQAMLYARLVEDGVRLAPVTRPLSRAVPRDSGGSLEHAVVHVHWTAAILQSSPGPLEALRRLDAFMAEVHRVRSRGATLVWTVHNVLPHECRHLSVEVELCRFLARTADVIHVMDTSTREAARDWYEIPEDRMVVVPHSSYAGVYPDVVGRVEARRRLGLDDDEVALLLLGRIRPYKGVDLLLDAFDGLSASDSRLRLLVAGKAERIPDLEGWRRRLDDHPAVTVELEHVPDDHVQVWCRAADVAVLPYSDVLNSGGLHLALTFDLPVVVPATGSLRGLADPAYARTFTAGSVDSLEEAVRSAVADLVSAEARSAARAAARANPPELMARRFAEALGPRVPGWGPGVAVTPGGAGVAGA